jgi:branched-chain amino acid transport system substrate-binding protein
VHSYKGVRTSATSRASICGSFLAALALLTSCTAASPAGAPSSKVSEIRVGLLFPTTGSMGYLGTDQAGGVKAAVDYVNAHGGVGGAQVKIFEADAKSDPAVAATETQRLIDQNKVQIVIGSYSSALAEPASTVAERNGVVFWEIGAVAVNLTQKGYKYFFRTLGDATTFAAADIDYLTTSYAAAIGKTPETVRIAIANENGPFGSSVADALKELIQQKHLQLVASESYAASSTDLTPVVLRLKDANPDILFIVPLPADSLLLYDQARTQGFNVKMMIGSAGFSSPSFLERFQQGGIEGVMDVEAPAVAGMNPSGLKPDIAELLKSWVADFKQRYGHEALVHAGDGMAGTWVLVNDVLPRAISKYGGVDAEAIRKSAQDTDIPDGGTLQGYGVKFVPTGQPNAGNNERGKSYIMQWKQGTLKVVFPSSLAVTEPQVPLPAWTDRK